MTLLSGHHQEHHIFSKFFPGTSDSKFQKGPGLDFMAQGVLNPYAYSPEAEQQIGVIPKVTPAGNRCVQD